MIIKKLRYLPIILTLLLNSCTEIINVDLNNAPPQVVIEGVITDESGPYTVKVSSTESFDAPNAFSGITGAIVVISDSQGNTDSLKEASPGIYQTSTLKGKQGITYTLTVNTGGKEYHSVTTMQKALHIDSMSYNYSTAAQRGSGNKPGYDLHCYFKTNPLSREYCLLRLYKNGQLDDSFFLFDDKLASSSKVDYHKFGQRFQQNDTLKVELMNIESTIHSYFKTLNDILHGNGLMAGPPNNPNSNITNGALGYFAAWSPQKDSVIIR